MPTSITSDQIKRIKQACVDVKKTFEEKHQDVIEWMSSHDFSFEDIRLASQQLLAATSFAGAVALNHPVVDMEIPQAKAAEPVSEPLVDLVTAEEHDSIIQKLQSIVQMPPGHMEPETELYMEQQLSDMLGFEVTAELDGHRLNHSIGIMGGEQHLKRFPTDTLEKHIAVQEAGIAANRGAFGWFTEGGELTQRSIEREKYYFAVQTMYLPQWNQQHPSLKEWYKFRKMIVINPAEQTAVVGVVGDAGPAAWVKKQFGGSPEVIREAKIWSPKSKGRVLLFFVEDPSDTIPLGPISLEYTHES